MIDNVSGSSPPNVGGGRGTIGGGGRWTEFFDVSDELDLIFGEVRLRADECESGGDEEEEEFLLIKVDDE